MLIAVNRGRGQRLRPPPRPSSPLPVFCPWKRGVGVSPTLQLALFGAYWSLWGNKRGGHQGSGSPEHYLLWPPRSGTKHYPSLRPPGPMAVPAPGPLVTRGGRGQEGWAQMYGADPTVSHWRRARPLGEASLGEAKVSLSGPAPAPSPRQGREQS